MRIDHFNLPEANNGMIIKISGGILGWTTAVLFLSACTQEKYRIPKEYLYPMQKNEGIIRAFHLNDTGNYFIFEKQTQINNDTFFTQIEYDAYRVYDSTCHNLSQKFRPETCIFLETPYGRLKGDEKLIARRETQNNYTEILNFNFQSLIQVTQTRQGRYEEIINPASKTPFETEIVEILKTETEYTDIVVRKTWNVNHIDSIFYRRNLGICKIISTWSDLFSRDVFLLDTLYMGASRREAKK